jgi:hypothetical protein
MGVICGLKLSFRARQLFGFYAKLGSVLSLISFPVYTFFKGGKAISFVQPLSCSVKIHG